MNKFRLVADLYGATSEVLLRAPERITRARLLRALYEGNPKILFDVKVFAQDNAPGWRNVMRRPDGRRKSSMSLAEYWRCRGMYPKASRVLRAFYKLVENFEKEGGGALYLTQL